jgi:hypothetical protein
MVLPYELTTVKLTAVVDQLLGVKPLKEDD